MIQEITPELSLIKERPQTHDNIHESCYRSTSILAYVLKMVDRGDSKETIMDVYYHLSR